MSIQAPLIIIAVIFGIILISGIFKELKDFVRGGSSLGKFLRRIICNLTLIATIICIGIGAIDLKKGVVNLTLWNTVAITTIVTLILALADIIIGLKKLKQDIKSQCDIDMQELISTIKKCDNSSSEDVQKLLK